MHIQELGVIHEYQCDRSYDRMTKYGCRHPAFSANESDEVLLPLVGRSVTHLCVSKEGLLVMLIHSRNISNQGRDV